MITQDIVMTWTAHRLPWNDGRAGIRNCRSSIVSSWWGRSTVTLASLLRPRRQDRLRLVDRTTASGRPSNVGHTSLGAILRSLRCSAKQFRFFLSSFRDKSRETTQSAKTCTAYWDKWCDLLLRHSSTLFDRISIIHALDRKTR